MENNPGVIYVRSVDSNNNPNGYVKAKYLTDASGNYVMNPVQEKFNIFVKDENGQYVSYLSESEQQGIAVPYIVPYYYDPTFTASQFSSYAQLPAALIELCLFYAYKQGGVYDRQRSYNEKVNSDFVPAFKAIASYDFGIACEAVNMMTTCMESAGTYNKINKFMPRQQNLLLHSGSGKSPSV